MVFENDIVHTMRGMNRLIPGKVSAIQTKHLKDSGVASSSQTPSSFSFPMPNIYILDRFGLRRLA